MDARRFLALVDRLDDMFHTAPRAGLCGGIRIDREAAYEVLDELRASCDAPPEPAPEGEWVARGELVPIVKALDDLARTGRRVPLTGGVRVDSEALHDAVDRLRKAVGPIDRGRL